MFTYVHIFLVFWDVLGRRRWQFQLSSLQWIPSEHPWLSFHVIRPRKMSCFQTSSHNRVTVQTYLGITCDFYLRSDAICEKATFDMECQSFPNFIFPAPKKRKGYSVTLLNEYPDVLESAWNNAYQAYPNSPSPLRLSLSPSQTRLHLSNILEIWIGGNCLCMFCTYNMYI